MTLQTQGGRIVGSNGDPIRHKAPTSAPWLNVENFITGYAASESMMRAAMLAVLGSLRAG
jgi:endoglucanase